MHNFLTNTVPGIILLSIVSGLITTGIAAIFVRFRQKIFSFLHKCYQKIVFLFKTLKSDLAKLIYAIAFLLIAIAILLYVLKDFNNQTVQEGDSGENRNEIIGAPKDLNYSVINSNRNSVTITWKNISSPDYFELSISSESDFSNNLSRFDKLRIENSKSELVIEWLDLSQKYLVKIAAVKGLKRSSISTRYIDENIRKKSFDEINNDLQFLYNGLINPKIGLDPVPTDYIIGMIDQVRKYHICSMQNYVISNEDIVRNISSLLAYSNRFTLSEREKKLLIEVTASYNEKISRECPY